MKVVAFKGNPGEGHKEAPKVVKRIVDLAAAAVKFLNGPNGKLPVISIFGHDDLELATPIRADYEEKRLDCRCYASDSKLEKILVQDKPHVVVTIGDRLSFSNLAEAPFHVRKRWLHYDVLPDLNQLGVDAYNCYLGNMFSDREEDEEIPLVTVFTPAYKTGEKIYRAFQSLKEQTYTNWEWIIVDDSDDDGKTFKLLSDLAKKDHRIEVFKPWEHSGIIGKVKNWACSLGKGHILVELDHDDQLTDYALDYVVKGFKQFPDAGFLYTDCAEVLNGRCLTYRDGWAFGYGSYTDVEYRGKPYKSGSGGNINSKTIRHIVSCPNHLRAWRKPFYESIGGHNKELHVADDYELMVRTFLKTRMIRVPKLCYLQYISNTAQQTRNMDIQRHVRSIKDHYDRRIHDRFLELGCEDFTWDEKKGESDYTIPNPGIEPHVTLISNV